MNSTRQIIDAALVDSPLDIKNAIETVIGEKIANALEEKKVTVARGLMGESINNKPKKGIKENLDIESFKVFLSEELEMELDNEDVEFLLEDMDKETFDQIMSDYNQKLNESNAKSK